MPVTVRVCPEGIVNRPASNPLPLQVFGPVPMVIPPVPASVPPVTLKLVVLEADPNESVPPVSCVEAPLYPAPLTLTLPPLTRNRPELAMAAEPEVVKL